MLDVLLHGVAAFTLCSIFVYATTPWKFMAVANAVFWTAREMAQHDWEFRWDLEWIVPALTGAIACYVFRNFKSVR